MEKSLTKTFLLHLAVMEEQDVISEEELAEVCEAVGKLVDDPKYTASFECESS